MNSYDSLFEKITAFAKEDSDVQAMVVFGSRARTEKPADEFSDYDIIFFVDNVEKFVKTDGWLSSIAPYFISFTEYTAVQDYERRFFFDNAMDMDFIFYNAADAVKITETEIIRSWFSRGYRVIVDKIGYAEIAAKAMAQTLPASELMEDEFSNLVQTFWFHAIWSQKKLLRGEIWAAKNCIDGYMKTLLRQMWEFKQVTDNWHDGRFLDERLPEALKLRLNDAYGTYSRESLEQALLVTMDLFSDAAQETAKARGFKYATLTEKYAGEQVGRLQNKHCM